MQNKLLLTTALVSVGLLSLTTISNTAHAQAVGTTVTAMDGSDVDISGNTGTVGGATGGTSSPNANPASHDNGGNGGAGSAQTTEAQGALIDTGANVGTISNTTTITATGGNGGNGGSGGAAGNVAPAGATGATGGNAGNAGSGGIATGIATNNSTIGTIDNSNMITATGGNGGSGGSGGFGGSAGADPDGGGGANGGNGGNGGSGGNGASAGAAFGISATNSSVIGTIVNSGTIMATGGDGGAGSSGGNGGGGAGGNPSGGNGGNGGNGGFAGTGANGVGINVDNSTVTTINNTGVITATAGSGGNGGNGGGGGSAGGGGAAGSLGAAGSNRAAGATGSAVGIQVTNGGTVTTINNTGTITATGTNSSGISVVNSAVTNINVDTGGSITGTRSIFMNNLTATTNINLNGGTLSGNILDQTFGTGNSVLNVNSDFTTGGNDVQISTLNIGSGNTFTLSGGDTLTHQNLTIGVGTGGTAGQLVNAGGAIDLNGLTVSANVTGSDGSLVGVDEILFADGTAQVIGLGGGAGQTLTAIADTSVLFDFEIADGSQAAVTTGGADNTELYFLLTQVGTLSSVVVDNSGSAGNTQGDNILGASGTVDGLLDGSGATGTLDTVLNNIIAASTVEELNAIVASILPSEDRSSYSAAQEVSNNTLRLVSDRLTVLRGDNPIGGSGISSGDITEGLQMWGQVFGQSINQGIRDGVPGFDADTQGVTVGIDTETLSDKATVGVSFTYANTDVKSSSVNNSRSTIDSYMAALYGDYDFPDDVYLSGAIGYTYGDNDVTRFNVGGIAGLNANSDYASHQGEARLVAGKNYNVQTTQGGLKLTPQLSAHYVYYKPDDVSETGAGTAGLNIENDALQAFQVGVGLDISKATTLKDGSIFTPELSVGYRYDLIGDTLDADVTFQGGGAAFSVDGPDPAQSTFEIGVGAVYANTDNWEFSASYDYNYKEDFNSHSGLVRAAYQF